MLDSYFLWTTILELDFFIFSKRSMLRFVNLSPIDLVSIGFMSILFVIPSKSWTSPWYLFQFSNHAILWYWFSIIQSIIPLGRLIAFPTLDPNHHMNNSFLAYFSMLIIVIILYRISQRDVAEVSWSLRTWPPISVIHFEKTRVMGVGMSDGLWWEHNYQC